MTTKRKSQSATHNYIAVGVKGHKCDDSSYARPLINILSTKLDYEPELDIKIDKAQTGTGSLQYDNSMNIVGGKPEFNDKIRFCEGFEELLYGLLGSYEKEDYTKDGQTVPNVFKYTFDSPVWLPSYLPPFTIWHGFSMTQDDGSCCNNAMLNTYELTTSQNELPTICYKFASDPIETNFPNPPSLFPTIQDKEIRRGEKVTWYIGSNNATEYDMLNNPITSLTKGTFIINNNIDKRKAKGSLTIKDNDFYKHDFMCHAQLWCKIESDSMIHDTTVPYSVLYKFPDVDIKKVDNSFERDYEFSVNETAFESFMTAEVITDLYALRIDEKCITKGEILE